jgi:hypothetical protein
MISGVGESRSGARPQLAAGSFHGEDCSSASEGQAQASLQGVG